MHESRAGDKSMHWIGQRTLFILPVGTIEK
jgi:hypothetical protein